MASFTSTDFYRYDGSVASLDSGLLSTSLLNSGASVGSATLSDPNGFLSATDDTGATFTLAGVTGPVEFIGTGTISTLGFLGVKLDPRPVAVFSVNGQIYFYAPNGLPLLSGLSVSFDIYHSGTLTFPAIPDGQVDGLETGENMLLGYADKQGDQITTDNDIIRAYEGNDTVDANAGNDTVYGGVGDDSLSGGTGADLLYGDVGNDRLFGGDEADTLQGGDGNDSLDGGAGADQLFGGAGDDTLSGGAGNDTLSGGAGSDSIGGGDGDDSFVKGATFGNDTVTGGEAGETAGDLLDLSAVTAGLTVNLTASEAGTVSDGTSVLSFSQIERVLLGSGNDSVTGSGGADSVAAGAGNDTLIGEAGNDTLEGGDGADSLDGGAGDDVLSGGAGNDTLAGGSGADLLTGGGGVNRFVVDGSGDTITDFNATAGVTADGLGSQSDNDLVDLSSFYNATTLAAYNAANPTRTFNNALAWLRADQADDGVLQGAGSLRLQSGAGVAVVAGQLSLENTNVVCFTRGTLIATERGQVPVERLAVGDRVVTVDHGPQPLRWVGSRRVAALGRLAPIHFEAGSIGNLRALGVSPQHRMMMRGPRVELFFGEAEVLVPARFLQNGRTIRRVEGGLVEYWHLLFDAHEIVLAEGVPAESLYLGAEGVAALSEASQQEIHAVFPHLRDARGVTTFPPARRVLQGWEAAVLCAGTPMPTNDPAAYRQGAGGIEARRKLALH